jgi:predicted membrane chloride channel (bestrophin family)
MSAADAGSPLAGTLADLSQYGTLTAMVNAPQMISRITSHKKLFPDLQAKGALQESQIVTYDLHTISDMRVLVWPWVAGSIFRRRRIWWQILAYLVLVVLLTGSLLLVVDKPFFIDYKIAQALSAYFNVFLPFLFGIYLNNVFTRWWNMRTLGIGELNNSVNNLCVIMASHLTGPEGGRPRHLLVRYGLLSLELIYRAARGTDGDLSDLVSSGSMSQGEQKALIDLPGGVKAQAVWAWVQMLMDDQFRTQRIPRELHLSVQNEIIKGRTAVKTIFTHLSTPIPFAYVHLMACLVHVNLLLLVLQAGMVCTQAIGKILLLKSKGETKDHLEAIGVHEDGEAGMHLFAQLLLLVMVPVLYLGFLELAFEITDPFGTDHNDFPRAMIHNTMQDECEAIFKVAEAPPAELTSVLQADKRGAVQKMPGDSADRV